MAKKRASKKRVRRNRMSVVCYTAQGSRLEWATTKGKSHSLAELSRNLRRVADEIDGEVEAHGSSVEG